MVLLGWMNTSGTYDNVVVSREASGSLISNSKVHKVVVGLAQKIGGLPRCSICISRQSVKVGFGLIGISAWFLLRKRETKFIGVFSLFISTAKTCNNLDVSKKHQDLLSCIARYTLELVVTRCKIGD